MSNYELYEHKKSDTVKWVLTLIAFIVVGVLIAGLIAGWFDKKEDAPAAVTEQTAAIDGGLNVTPVSANGIRLMAGERVVDAGVSAQAETTSYTVTATIEPAGALQKADWSLAWANGSSSWASGKTVTDYVTVSTSEDGGLTATVTLVKPFSEQIILTAAARGNSSKTATCTVDYQQRLVVNSLKFGDVALSTTTCNLKVDLFESYYADLDFSYSEGSLAYLSKGENDYDEFSGSSIGLMDSGVDFTVEGSADYEVNVYAYCTPENDFSLTVGEEPYTWSDFDGRNVTAGFDFERTETGFTVTHYGLNDIVSRVQNGMTVTSENYALVDMFRMEVKSGEEVTELYFCVNAEVVGITIDHGAIIF